MTDTLPYGLTKTTKDEREAILSVLKGSTKLAESLKAIATAQRQKPTEQSGPPANYVQAVIEASAEGDQPESAVQIFLDRFLRLPPQYTSSPVGLCAMAFEASIIAKLPDVYRNFIETIVQEDVDDFLAVFEGAITPEHLDQLEILTRSFCEVEPLLIGGMNSQAVYEVSDITILAATPTVKAEEIPVPKQLSNIRGYEDASKVYQESKNGITPHVWRKLHPEAQIDEQDTTKIQEFRDGLGLLWRGDGVTWFPEPPSKPQIDLIEAARVLHAQGYAGRLRLAGGLPVWEALDPIEPAKLAETFGPDVKLGCEGELVYPAPSMVLACEATNLTNMFSLGKNGVTNSFVDAMWKKHQAGQPISRMGKGTVEDHLRDAQKAGQLKSREHVAAIVRQHYPTSESVPGNIAEYLRWESALKVGEAVRFNGRTATVTEKTADKLVLACEATGEAEKVHRRAANFFAKALAEVGHPIKHYGGSSTKFFSPRQMVGPLGSQDNEKYGAVHTMRAHAAELAGPPTNTIHSHLLSRGFTPASKGPHGQVFQDNDLMYLHPKHPNVGFRLNRRTTPDSLTVYHSTKAPVAESVSITLNRPGGLIEKAITKPVYGLNHPNYAGLVIGQANQGRHLMSKFPDMDISDHLRHHDIHKQMAQTKAQAANSKTGTVGAASKYDVLKHHTIAVAHKDAADEMSDFLASVYDAQHEGVVLPVGEISEADYANMMPELRGGWSWYTPKDAPAVQGAKLNELPKHPSMTYKTPRGMYLIKPKGGEDGVVHHLYFHNRNGQKHLSGHSSAHEARAAAAVHYARNFGGRLPAHTLKEYPKIVNPTESEQPTNESQFGTWSIEPLGAEDILIRTGDQFFKTKGTVQEVQEFLQTIEDVYEGLPSQRDLMIEQVLREYAKDNGQTTLTKESLTEEQADRRAQGLKLRQAMLNEAKFKAVDAMREKHDSPWRKGAIPLDLANRLRARGFKLGRGHYVVKINGGRKHHLRRRDVPRGWMIEPDATDFRAANRKKKVRESITHAVEQDGKIQVHEFLGADEQNRAVMRLKGTYENLAHLRSDPSLQGQTVRLHEDQILTKDAFGKPIEATTEYFVATSKGWLASDQENVFRNQVDESKAIKGETLKPELAKESPLAVPKNRLEEFLTKISNEANEHWLEFKGDKKPLQSPVAFDGEAIGVVEWIGDDDGHAMHTIQVCVRDREPQLTEKLLHSGLFLRAKRLPDRWRLGRYKQGMKGMTPTSYLKRVKHDEGFDPKLTSKTPLNDLEGSPIPADVAIVAEPTSDKYGQILGRYLHGQPLNNFELTLLNTPPNGNHESVVDEVSPPGFSGTIAKMKADGMPADQAFAIGWANWKRGYKPHVKPEPGKPKYRPPNTARK